MKVTISWACGPASETATPGFDARPRKLRGARAELVVEARGANASRRVLRAVGERYAHRCGLAQETLGPSACAVRDYTSPVLYHARVPVAPGERYAYRVASDAAGPWRYFRAPRQGPNVRFAVRWATMAFTPASAPENDGPIRTFDGPFGALFGKLALVAV